MTIRLPAAWCAACAPVGNAVVEPLPYHERPMLMGVDNRSSAGRRYRDLVCIYAAEFEIRTDGDLSQVETAAGLKLGLETLTAALVRGERVDDGELAKLSGELRAVLASLRSRKTDGRPDDRNGGADPEDDD